MFNLKILFACLLMAACSSTRDQGPLDQVSDDFMASFDVGEDLSKFSTETKEKQVAAPAPIPSSQKKKNAVNKKNDSVKAEEDLEQKYLEYDRKSKKLWAKFTPVFYPGEEAVYRVKFFGVTVGNVKINVNPFAKLGGLTAYHISAHMRSARFYEYIYSIDDRLDSYIDQKRFLPLKFALRQVESKQKVDDLQLFDLDQKMTYFLYERLKKREIKKVNQKLAIPGYFQDPFSAVFWIRGMPLNKGVINEIPVVSKAKVRIFRAEILGEEIIRDEKDREISAIKLQAMTLLSGKMSEEEKKKEQSNLVVWISNDEFRRVLRVSAKVKIGSLEGELLEYRPGQKMVDEAH